MQLWRCLKFYIFLSYIYCLLWKLCMTRHSGLHDKTLRSAARNPSSMCNNDYETHACSVEKARACVLLVVQFYPHGPCRRQISGQRQKRLERNNAADTHQWGANTLIGKHSTQKEGINTYLHPYSAHPSKPALISHTCIIKFDVHQSISHSIIHHHPSPRHP